MANLEQPPQPFCGRVTSTIQFGARRGVAEERNVFQSALVDGEKIFIPVGQLFFWVDLYTVVHSEHLTRSPAEYSLVRSIFVHLHEVGDPEFGCKSIFNG
jgi:hypothetical protein